MIKTYLIDYYADKFQPLQSGCFHYTLTLKKVWFWGLFETTKTIPFEISYHANAQDHFDLWDKLIDEQKAIK